MKNRNDVLSDMPMGFGMALVQNSEAMNYFTNLSAQRQQEILEATHYIESKQEMKNFVANLAGFSD